MNYTKIYNQLIERAKNRKPERDGYYERHHIIPKCMGGSDDKANLVKLMYREHFIAHWLLHRENPTNKSLSAAFHIMVFGMGRGNVRKKRNNGWIPSSRQLEEARIANVGKPLSEDHKQKIGKASLGNTNMLGKTHSKEARKKMGEAHLGNTNMLGKTHSKEVKQKMREAHLGKTHSEETKQKIGKASLGNTHMLGKTHSEETKQKVREARLGKKYITNGNEIKAINPTEELPIGWRYGRKKPNTIVNNKWW